MATPARVLAVEPPVTASVVSAKALPNRLVTLSPAALTLSSAMGVSAVEAAVRVGASLTGVMVISTVLLAVSAPPVPVLPWSLTVTTSDCSLPAPTVLMLAVGVKFSVAKAALRLAWVPVNTILVSVVPSPVVKVNPVSVPSVIVPLGDEPKSSVTSSRLEKESLSAKLMPTIAVLLLSSATVAVSGAETTGASLLPDTLMLNVALAVLLPPIPLPSAPLPKPAAATRSSTVVVMTTVASAFGLVGV